MFGGNGYGAPPAKKPRGAIDGASFLASLGSEEPAGDAFFEEFMYDGGEYDVEVPEENRTYLRSVPVDDVLSNPFAEVAEVAGVDPEVEAVLGDALIETEPTEPVRAVPAKTARFGVEKERPVKQLVRKKKQQTFVISDSSEESEKEERAEEENERDLSSDEEGEEEDEDEEDEEEYVDSLLTMCQDCSERLVGFLSKFSKTKEQTSSILVADKSELEEAPANIGGKLHDYQLSGMNWLYLLHKFQMNSILADEMGLGKTIQVISFLGLLLEKGIPGPHIVVVPTTTLDNWVREIGQWYPSLSVLRYHGNLKERSAMRVECPPDYLDCENTKVSPRFNILLTTYAIASSKFDRSFLRRCNFEYMIVDEAQNIKNAASKRFEKLASLSSRHHILLTGTPLQNNLKELWNLMEFLMPDIIDTSNTSRLRKEFFASNDQKCIDRMKEIISPFLLRRLKKDVITDVVTKTHVDIPCKMEERQRAMYMEVFDSSKKKLTEETDLDGEIVIDDEPETSEGDISRPRTPTNSGEIRNILMDLRKMANHPLLFRRKYTDAMVGDIAKIAWQHNSRDQYVRKLGHGNLFLELQHMSDFEIHSFCVTRPHLKDYLIQDSDLFASAKLVALMEKLSELKKDNVKVLVFSVMTRVLDIIETALTFEEYQYLRLDGSTPVNTRQELVDTFNTSTTHNIFLLSTMAAGQGINLTSANTVIFYDISFNPQMERQAEDRCHRIGQTKPVTVYRLVAENTIDEQMLKLSKQKLELNDRVLEEGSYSAAGGDASAGGKNLMSRMIHEIFGIKKT